MSRKGENIYKRKDGRWEGRYLKRTPDGKRRYGYVYASTYREVKARLQKAAALWESEAAKQKAAALSLTTMAGHWQQSIAHQVKESTYVKYHLILQKHLCPALGDICVEDMTHEIIEDFAAGLLRGEKEGRPLSPRTVADIMSVLRSVLRFARRTGAVIPCDGSSVRIRRKPTQIRVLTMTEQTILCRHLYNDLTPKNAGILLSLFAGLRVGELCALRWEDISASECALTVRRTMQRITSLDPDGPRTKLLISTPKTATSLRTIPLPKDLLAVLLRQPGAHKGYFLTGQEERSIEPRAMEYYFTRLTERLGLPHANFHALRHTFATRCVELGFDVKSLSELLGHSTVSMTLDRYVHPTIEHKREHMQQFSRLIQADLPARPDV